MRRGHRSAPLLAALASLVALALFAHAPAARAQGASSAFSLNPADARAMAMGGVLTLLPHDDTAMRWNPALLVFATRISATASFSAPAAGLSATRASLTAARPLGEPLPVPPGELPMHSMAVGVLVASSGLDLSEGARWSETQLGAGFAYSLTSYLTAGATLRLLSNSTDAADAKVSGFAGDFGLCALMTPSVELGLVFHNLLSHLSWSDLSVTETLPSIVDADMALHLNELQGEVGLELSSAEATRIHLGAEYLAMDGKLPIRAGVRMFFGGEVRAVPTFGVGMVRNSVHVDVAAVLDKSTALGKTLGASVGASF